MIKRFSLFFLIVLVPIQSWAVVDMSLQKEAMQFDIVLKSSDNSHHPCHQEMVHGAETENSEVGKVNCNACSLCIAFGTGLTSNLSLHLESPTQFFFTDLPQFGSEDLLLVIKPPIL